MRPGTDMPRGDVDEANRIFRSPHYVRHNQRRLEHLESLGLDLFRRTVLEPGAGVGDHTMFYLDRHCHVTAVEPRPANFRLLLRTCEAGRHGRARAFTGVQDDFWSIERMQGTFDVVHAYGILYHLDDPERALRILAERCHDLLLLETCVTSGEDASINPVREDDRVHSQAIGGVGCRPTRPWVMRELKRHFPWVYVPLTQPAHEQFPNDWSRPRAPGALTRAVFIASRRPLANPVLTSALPTHQPRRLRPRPSPQPPSEVADLLARHDIPLLLDVGANAGQYAAKIRGAGFKGRIVSFEPLSTAFARLAACAEADPMWSAENVALGAAPGEVEIGLSANSYSSSILPAKPEAIEIEPEIRVVGRETVRMDTLDRAVARHATTHEQVFLKIDVQGYELNVLEGAGDLLRRTRFIQMECSTSSIYVGEPLIEEKISYLRRRGFEIAGIELGWRHPATGELLQVDLLFRRIDP